MPARAVRPGHAEGPVDTDAGPGPVERIAVVRALPGVGDLLCAVPALRAVRAAHPHAHVTLVGLPSAAWFVDRYRHLLDDLLVAAGVDGLPEVAPDADAAVAFHTAARARRFDLALQLHGSGVASNPVTTLLGARHQVSTWVPGRWRPPGTTVRHRDDLHEIDRLLEVARAAGAPDVGTDVTFPVRPDDRAAAAALLGDAERPLPPYGCVHPGASRPANRWHPAGFAAVADRMAAAGLRVVLTGTRAERAVVADVARRWAGAPLDLAGCTTVGSLAALFAGARLVVSNDTGAAHVAAAVHAPSVVVFAPDGDPGRWAPRDGVRHRAVVPARPPDTGRLPRHGAAPAWPTVEAVLAAVDHQLSPGTPASPHPEVHR